MKLNDNARKHVRRVVSDYVILPAAREELLQISNPKSKQHVSLLVLA
jgi:hypothetical protein